MALQIFGFVTCFACGHSASAGVSREGSGKAIHVICKSCTTQIQTSRTSDVGRWLEVAAAERPLADEKDPMGLNMWDCEIANAAPRNSAGADDG